MARFTHLRPMLWTEELQDTINFYTTTLGFTLDEYREEWQWASLSKDDISVMLAKPNEHEVYNHIGFTGSFYFTVDDVAALWEDLRDRCRICSELDTFEWGMKEFAIYDINGYILQFGEIVE